MTDETKHSVKMNSATIVDTLIKDIRERLTLDGWNRVFYEGEKLRPEFMKETAEPEAFTREFMIDKIFDALELEKLSEKKIEDSRGLRSVDYRIKSKRGRFLVEAKPLNADLEKGKDSGVNQIKGLFKLAEVQKNYDFGVATNGLRWIFIDRNEEIVDDLNLEEKFEQIKEFLVGKEKVVSQKTEEEISKKFYGWYNALLHGGKYKNHENKQKTVSEEDCLVNNVIGVRDLEEREQIAQVVMNRLIFIKFLQSKGIIEEDVLKYLSEVKEDELTPKLRQLFFGAMNTPEDQRQDINERFKDIPYLNGSLFTHIEVEKRNLDYKVKSEILKEVIAFLDSFKFVHKEQLGNGDSIDPEILGYIFERAMTGTDRKGTGAYYTPKPITKYISENTIYPFIIEKTNEILKTEKGYKDTESIKDIEELFILPATTLKEIWDKIILKVRVLDNACGSGAFLLAAANILFSLNRKISDKLGAENPDTTLKIWILVNNLYGVDINPNGIEIAKLRLWLWLADSYEPGYIKPLPNIDYNLRVGNSLIGYVDLGEFKETKLTLSDFLWNEEKDTLDNLLKERIDLIREYKITWGEEAKELKSSVQEFDEKISNLLNADLYKKLRDKKIQINREEFLKLNPFHWGFEFYEVFDLDTPKEERGFDVVIGNPPYIEVKKIEGYTKPILRNIYHIGNREILKGRYDIFWAFYANAIQLLREKGYLAYISSESFLDALGADNLRQHIVTSGTLLRLNYVGNPFQGPQVSTIILEYTKEKCTDYRFYLSNWITKSIASLKKSEVLKTDRNIININIVKNRVVEEILKEIEKDSVELGYIIYLQQGMILQSEKYKKKDFIYKTKKDQFVPYIEGKDINRYFLPTEHRWLDYQPSEHHRSRIKEVFTGKKLLVRRIADGVKACIDYGKFFTDNTIYTGTLYYDIDSLKQKYHRQLRYSNESLNKSKLFSYEFLLGIINSKLMTFYFYSNYKTFSLNVLNKLKIRPPSDNYKCSIGVLSSYLQFLNSRFNSISILDKTLDSLVYELYFKDKFAEEGLKTNLLELVEPYLKDIENLKTEEEKLEVIKEVVEGIKSDGEIKKEIEKIKGHEWVKVVEGEGK